MILKEDFKKGYDPIGNIICDLESQTELTIADEIAEEEYNRVYTIDYYGNFYVYSKKYDDEFKLIWDKMDKSIFVGDYNWYFDFLDKFIMDKLNAEEEHDLCELDEIVCALESQSDLLIADEIAEEEYNKVYYFDYYGTKFYYSKKYDNEFILIWNAILKSCSEDEYNWYSYFWNKFIMEKLNDEIYLYELDGIDWDLEPQPGLTPEEEIQYEQDELELEQINEVWKSIHGVVDDDWWCKSYNECELEIEIMICELERQSENPDVDDD